MHYDFRRQFLLILSLVLFSLTGLAGDVAPEVEERILEALREARPDFEYRDVEATPIDGVYQVRVVHGPLLYVDGSGEYFIAGELFQAMPGQFVNLSDLSLARERKRLLEAVPVEEMIIFAPDEPKEVITVFTDVDCGYCRQLHREMEEYNRRGIEVRYLAFPRQGIGTPTAAKMISAWCSKDRKQSLTDLKNGKSIPNDQCDGQPVARQFDLGREVGVRGTPAIILGDGSMIPGYQAAAELARVLGLE